MILAAHQILERNPKPTEDQIRHQLEGNLCRCTGYHNIVKAIQWAAENMPREEVRTRDGTVERVLGRRSSGARIPASSPGKATTSTT